MNQWDAQAPVMECVTVVVKDVNIRALVRVKTDVQDVSTPVAEPVVTAARELVFILAGSNLFIRVARE